jgi:hypothetical protein
MNKDELLSRLWELTVHGLIDKLESGEFTSQDINVARQLLRDHGVNAEITDDSPMVDLSRVLPFKANTEAM